jgi:hypothetical protein
MSKLRLRGRGLAKVAVTSPAAVPSGQPIRERDISSGGASL